MDPDDFQRIVLEKLSAIEADLENLRDNQTGKLVSYEWIRRNLGWDTMTDPQIYHRLYRAQIYQKSKGFYLRSDLASKFQR